MGITFFPTVGFINNQQEMPLFNKLLCILSLSIMVIFGVLSAFIELGEVMLNYCGASLRFKKMQNNDYVLFDVDESTHFERIRTRKRPRR